MKGASVKVAILNFFTRQDLFVHHAKFHLLLRPPLPFWDIFRDLDKFCLLNNFLFFSVQNLGHIRTNCTVFLVVGVKMSKKWMSALTLFFHAPKPKGATLTYSALTHCCLVNLMALYDPNCLMMSQQLLNVFIEPEPDHWECLSLTDWLTDSLTPV